MSSTFDDTVRNFDLNFLQQPFSRAAVQTNEDRTRRGIIRVKRKIIATDCLIRKYYDKRDLLQQVEKSLVITKEECKQVCLDYKNAVDKCLELEKNVQMLQTANEELNKKCVDSENSCGALQSYTNQLQLQVKETETRVEALEVESKLEKTSTKDIKKKNSTLQGTNDVLLSHLSIAREILFGKKKLSKKFKELLQKYDKPVQDTFEDSDADDFETVASPASAICTEDFLENDNNDPHSEDIDRVQISTKSNDQNKDVDNDYDSSHEVVSEDTGRGSSLAFSDSDKCYQSPDYFSNDSPPSNVDISKTKSKYVDKSTSPIIFNESDIITDIFRDPIQKTTIDAVTSPLRIESNNSPVKNKERAASPIELHTAQNRIVIENDENQEMDCLELNNSQNLYHNNAEDSEVQMILNEMRLKCNLITPIPTSPSKSIGPDSTNQDMVRELMTDVGKIREDNKMLYSMFATVTKSIVSMQNTLINQSIKNCSGNCKCKCSTKEIRIPVEATVNEHNLSSFINNELSATNTLSTPINIVQMREQNISSPIENALSVSNVSDSPANKDHFREQNISSPIENDSSKINNTLVRLQFEDPLTCLTQNDDILLENRLHSPIVSSTHVEDEVNNSKQDVKSQEKRKVLKLKRLAKMEFLRQKVIERRKIKRFIFLDRKLPIRTKRRILVKKKSKKIDSLDSLSNKVNREEAHKTNLESSLRPVAKSNDNDKEVNFKPLLNKVSESNKKAIDNIEESEIEFSHDPIVNKVKGHKIVSTTKKMSRLEKLRKQNLPRGKIRKHVTQTKKGPRIKPKQLMPHTKEIKTSDSSASLNDKDVYEKACKVMAELKSKQKNNYLLEKRAFKKPSAMTEKRKHSSKKLHPSQNSENDQDIQNSSFFDVAAKKQLSTCNVDKSSMLQTLPNEMNTEGNILNVKKMQHIKTTTPVICRNTRRLTRLSGSDEIIHDSQSLLGESNACIESNPENNGRPTLLSSNEEIIQSSPSSSQKGSNSINLKTEITVTKGVIESQTSSKSTMDIKENQQVLNKNSPNKCFNEDNRYVVVVVEDVLKDKSEILGKSDVQLKDTKISDKNDVEVEKEINRHSLRQFSRKRRDRDSVDKLESPHKRVLRSSTIRQLTLDFDQDDKNYKGSETGSLEARRGRDDEDLNGIVKYDDLDMFKNKEESIRICERDSVNTTKLQNKRVLRSSNTQQSQLDIKDISKLNSSVVLKTQSDIDKSKKIEIINYCDLDIFSTVEKSTPEQNVKNLMNNSPKIITRSLINSNDNVTLNVQPEKATENQYKNNILCLMIEKYGRHSIKTMAKKVDPVVNSIHKKIENRITEITEMNFKDTKEAMNKFVEEIQEWDINCFVAGLMKYLENPARKTELFSKVYGPPAPALTKSEQILLYVIPQLHVCRPDYNIVNIILNNIEYILFRLHQTPVFEIIDSMSHFYAVLCRYFRKKSRLRMFILDAMYCIQYKSIPLIRQCLDVWMHILPLSHMGLAKTPLVVCLVYLLHFYKCEDKFHRAQDLRQILNRRYSYQMSDWNESRIMEILKNALHDMKEIPVEKKMLRMSIIIFAKRQGPRWCQSNIITNMLLPMIEGHNVSVRVKLFCISLLGPLLKPYPVDMKVHCEVVMDKLLDMLTKNPSEQMKEAIYTSLIYMHKHNANKVYDAMLSYNPLKISLDFEDLLRDLIREKPIKSWMNVFSRKQSNVKY